MLILTSLLSLLEQVLVECRAMSQADDDGSNDISNDTECVVATNEFDNQQNVQDDLCIETNVIIVEETLTQAVSEHSFHSIDTTDNYWSDTDSYLQFDDDEDHICDPLNDDLVIFNADEEEDIVDETNIKSIDEEKTKEAATKSSIAEWVIECNVPRSHVSNLLRRLRFDCGLSYLPLDSRTLLKTMRTKPILRSVFPGQYAHFGFVKGLLALLSAHNIDSAAAAAPNIRIIIHVDGIPISKSSGSQFWPILCTIYGAKKSIVVIIGIYHGLKKPADVNDFLKDFVAEASNVLKEGIQYAGRIIQVRIAALVCDAPARCLVTSVATHNAYFGCHKCTTEGVWIRNTVLSNHGGRVTYPEVNAPLRTDESFRTRAQPAHHNQKRGRSIIEHLLPFDLVKGVPVDYMHNVCIGVEKKLLRTWIFGKMDGIRISKQQVKAVSEFLVYIKVYVPTEIPRKTRTLDDFPYLKATEHRNHLLYFLPVALKGVLTNRMYDHYMLLHVAIKILVNSKHCRTYAAYAESLLKKFVTHCVQIYGPKFISYNVHNLIHLPADVQELGCLDSYSAFPFENKLQTIKNLMRTSANPLAQVIRRLKEIEEISTEDCDAPSSPAETVCSNDHVNGPIPLEFTGDQFKKMKLRNWTISTKRPDHCVFLSDGSVALVQNIIKNSEGDIFVYVKKYLMYEDLYISPLPSRTFQELVVSELGTELYMVNVNLISCKAIRFPTTKPKNGKFFVSPLFMD